MTTDLEKLLHRKKPKVINIIVPLVHPIHLYVNFHSFAFHNISKTVVIINNSYFILQEVPIRLSGSNLAIEILMCIKILFSHNVPHFPSLGHLGTLLTY